MSILPSPTSSFVPAPTCPPYHLPMPTRIARRHLLSQFRHHEPGSQIPQWCPIRLLGRTPTPARPQRLSPAQPTTSPAVICTTRSDKCAQSISNSANHHKNKVPARYELAGRRPLWGRQVTHRPIRSRLSMVAEDVSRMRLTETTILLYIRHTQQANAFPSCAPWHAGTPQGPSATPYEHSYSPMPCKAPKYIHTSSTGRTPYTQHKSHAILQTLCHGELASQLPDREAPANFKVG